MAEERIIEGTWRCTSCGALKIKGRHKTCPQCGNPRELTGSETEFDFGETTAEGASTAEAVTDAALLDAANAGADWFCPFCESSNRGDATRCRNCAADREPDARPAPAPPAPPVLPAASPAPARSGAARLGLGCGSLLLGAVTLLAGFCFWMTRTHETEGTVAARRWSRTVHRETFTRVEKRGWRDELKIASTVMPVSGAGERAGVERLRDCRRRQRGTRKVADGTERVCETKTRQKACGTDRRCRVQDMGNGFAKEVCENETRYCSESYQDCEQRTRYREEPVYGEECAYDTWEWRAADTQSLRGDDGAPRWPAVPQGAHDRVRQEETYAIVFRYRDGGQDKTVELPAKTHDEFEAWKDRDRATLVINNLGQLEEARPR